MSGGATPLASIPLRDGTELQIAPDGVRNGSKVIELAKIQDARRVSPSPEIIALRVAGMGLLEYEPERDGDGTIALEALYQLRPDLRPVGFGGQSEEPAYPGYPLIPGMPPNGPLPPGYPQYPQAPVFPASASPSYAEARALAERRARGLLTPFPRQFGETMAAIFQLFSSKFRIWFLLSLFLAPIAGILDGGANYLLFSRIVLVNASSATLSPNSCVLPAYQIETGPALIRDVVALVVLFGLSLLATALQTAVLSVAARDVTLDRMVSVKGSYREGLRKWGPTLWASFLVGSAYYLVLLPAGISYVALYVAARGTNLCVDTNSTNAVLSLGCLGSLFFVAGVALAILFAVRLGFAPYLAATHEVSAREAIAQSWQITRGHFWRAFGVILLTGVMVWLILQVVSAFPPILTVFVATPLVYVFTIPFISLTYITLLYDLLLRHDGYTALTQETTVPTSTPTAPAPPLR